MITPTQCLLRSGSTRFAAGMPSTRPNKEIRRRNPERTRAKLLTIAIRLFSARGFNGVTVDEIAEAADVNKRMVYHYFGSKQDIYRAAIEEVFHRLSTVELDAISSNVAPDEKLRRLIEANFAFLDTNPEFVRLLLWENLDNGQHMAAARESLSKNPFMDRFSAIVREGVAAGIFRAPHDERHLLVNFIGLCFVYYSNRHSLFISLGIGSNPEDRSLRLAQVLDLVFHGLKAPARSTPARK